MQKRRLLPTVTALASENRPRKDGFRMTKRTYIRYRRILKIALMVLKIILLLTIICVKLSWVNTFRRRRFRHVYRDQQRYLFLNTMIQPLR